MAKKNIVYRKNPSTGEIEYPVTSSAAVGMSNGSGSLDKYLQEHTTELNISVLYPTQGIDGTNKYDLATAIAQVPLKLR